MIKHITIMLSCIMLTTALYIYNASSSILYIAMTLSGIMLWLLYDRCSRLSEISFLEQKIEALSKSDQSKHLTDSLETIGYHVSIMASKNKDPELATDFYNAMGAITQTYNNTKAGD